MKKSILLATVFVLAVAFSFTNAYAGAPFINLEGVGGVGFNPLAYPADDGAGDHLKIGDVDVVGKPRFGAWYVNLSDAAVDWTVIGVATSFFKRLEVSYGYESVNTAGTESKHQNNIGAKLLMLPENSFDMKFLPAISGGVILKYTTRTPGADKNSGQDYYIVMTKLITQLPLPLLLSGGVLSTQARITGVAGYDKDRKITGFGNIDVILPWNFIAGFEYKQSPRYEDWKDSDYWNAHLAWTATKNLTLIAAYTDCGSTKNTSKVGLGNGVVLSVQYSF